MRQKTTGKIIIRYFNTVVVITQLFPSTLVMAICKY